jgi:hypothetical protein
MFADHKLAAQAIQSMKRVVADLDQMLIDLQGTAPAEEYHACRYAVGHVMAELFERLAEPIAANHPDLRYWA